MNERGRRSKRRRVDAYEKKIWKAILDKFQCLTSNPLRFYAHKHSGGGKGDGKVFHTSLSSIFSSQIICFVLRSHPAAPYWIKFNIRLFNSIDYITNFSMSFFSSSTLKSLKEVQSHSVIIIYEQFSSTPRSVLVWHRVNDVFFTRFSGYSWMLYDLVICMVL